MDLFKNNADTAAVKSQIQQEFVSSAQRYTVVTTVTKVLLAIIIVIAYFLESSWLIDLVVVAVVFSLVLPLGFYGAFIENLLEYNTSAMEDRTLLNANESNETFNNMLKRIDGLDREIAKLKEDRS